MRGARRRTHRVHGRSGIIPAYAGSTGEADANRVLNEDHPRVCGEHARTTRTLSFLKGSSPRMRGAPQTSQRGRSSRRIIPAYAGSTIRSLLAWGLHEDHPRVCGEHVLGLGVGVMPLGSSPRMRGARGLWAGPRRSGRIIPAYAGSTLSAVGRLSPTRDHPRVCEEHP